MNSRELTMERYEISEERILVEQFTPSVASLFVSQRKYERTSTLANAQEHNARRSADENLWLVLRSLS